MKKLFLVILLVLMATGVYAAWDNVSVSTWENWSKSCSTSAATEVRPARTNRINWSVTNPNATYSIYIATFSITSIATDGAWHEVLPGTTYWNPKGESPDGAIYILTEPTSPAEIVVSGDEMY